jgi:predicted nucleotidyltransferase
MKTLGRESGSRWRWKCKFYLILKIFKEEQMKKQFNFIEDMLEVIKKKIEGELSNNLQCLIIYGSWAKGTAKEDSDIDLLALFEKVDDHIRKFLYEIEKKISTEIAITLVPASVEEFQKEKIPLYTAIKKEGKVLSGSVDMTINPEPPHKKYAEYFEKSKRFETEKVEIAERILKEHPDYNPIDLCFIASKHAIQMALAMKGLGYSSKMAVLLPLVKELLGEEVAKKFKQLFDLYVKSEYHLEFLTPEEAVEAVKQARKILEICYRNP